MSSLSSIIVIGNVGGCSHVHMEVEVQQVPLNAKCCYARGQLHAKRLAS